MFPERTIRGLHTRRSHSLYRTNQAVFAGRSENLIRSFVGRDGVSILSAQCKDYILYNQESAQECSFGIETYPLILIPIYRY